MRLLRAILAVILCFALSSTPLFAQERAEAPAYFSLTSERTYLPGEKIEVAVYTHNVSDAAVSRLPRE